MLEVLHTGSERGLGGLISALVTILAFLPGVSRDIDLRAAAHERVQALVFSLSFRSRSLALAGYHGMRVVFGSYYHDEMPTI